MKLRGVLMVVVVLCLAIAGFTAYRLLRQPVVALVPVPAPGGPAAALGQFIPADPSRPAPEVSFASESGGNVSLADFHGRVVLLNLWATWCEPCVREMPALDRLQARLGGKDFAVVLVSQDRGGANVVDPFFAKLGLASLKTYLDPKSTVGHGFAVAGLPTSFLIDRDGTLLGTVQGAAAWDGGPVETLIRDRIAKDEKKSAAVEGSARPLP
jgi:thiol-disulfide isomerase/thioredoxin